MEVAPFKEEGCVGQEKMEWPYHQSCGSTVEQPVVRIVEQEEVEPVGGYVEVPIAEVDPLMIILAVL